MEKLFIVAVLLTACSCGERREEDHHFKYKVGDVVYIKPDSTVAVITDRYDYSSANRYTIKFYDSENESSQETLEEFEIYGIK